MKKVQNLRDYAARQRTDATLEAAIAARQLA
jgi:hypothetical protein